ncbi:MAG: S1/P1 nuclease [Chlamydiota bacterium]
MKRFFICFLFLFSSLWSWWDFEHMTIAKIAYDDLNNNEKQKVNKMIHSLDEFYPNMNTFISASVWADEMAARDFPPGKKWHGHPKAYDPTHFLSEKKLRIINKRICENDIILGIHQSIATLKNPKTNPLEKGIMLRYLIHLVGDIHMPLHCGSLYSPEFPTSDIAGTRYPIYLQGKKTTLNILWNSAFGKSPKRPKLPPTLENEKDIESFAEELLSSFPKESFTILKDKDISHWANESFEIVQNSVYQGISLHAEPSTEYIERNRKIAYERIALAGYRLAAILHEILQESSN